MTAVQQLRDIANILRRDSILATTEAGSGHPTSCLSCADILSTLFFSEMKYDVKDANNPNNDEFILSKGHAAPILYSALFRAGCIKDNLQTLRKLDSDFEGHPMPHNPWIKVSTGSLGQGLSVGVGMALAAKLSKRSFRTFVLMGDSESAEGSVYEAAQLASHYKLSNLIAIIDINRLGQRGETILGHNIKPLEARWKSFGWNTITINGHDFKEIQKALSTRSTDKPTIILAKTQKGHGVSFLQDKEGWHGKALDEEQAAKALHEIPRPKVPKISIKKPSKSNLKFTSGSPRQPTYKVTDLIEIH
jgi:transketolase